MSLGDHEAEEAEVDQDLRVRVFQRDGWQCQYCGESDIDKLTVHHVIFRSAGGKHYLNNLVSLCGYCHTLIHKRQLWVKRIQGHWYFTFQA